jgi:limonene 1,2-monooxygenase
MQDDRYIRTGIFLAPFHDLDENPTLAIDRDMELVCHLDKLGYHEAWIGEHHSGGFEIIASPEIFIAGAAERTRHIKLGTGVVSLPYHNPLMVADRMVQLDHQTRGRAMFGVGPGSLVYDADMLGLDPALQRDKLMQSLNVIVRLMKGERVTEKTEWYDLRDAKLQIPPYTYPMMEMAVASSRSPVGSLNAGLHGIGMLAMGGTSPDAMEAHCTNWRRYEDLARENGHSADRSKWRIVTFAHVAETREQAEKDMEYGLNAFRDYFSEVATFPIIPPDIEDPINYLREKQIACIGTPDDCIEHFERIWQGSQGGCGAILLLAHNWANWEATKKSYELMARYVHPHFQRGSLTWRKRAYDDAAEKYATAGAASKAAVEAAIEKHGARKTGL